MFSLHWPIVHFLMTVSKSSSRFCSGFAAKSFSCVFCLKVYCLKLVRLPYARHHTYLQLCLKLGNTLEHATVSMDVNQIECMVGYYRCATSIIHAFFFALLRGLLPLGCLTLLALLDHEVPRFKSAHGS